MVNITPYILFGGTFDPVHVGHLQSAWEVAQYCNAPVYLMPCYTPAHRDPPQATPQARLEMLELALNGQQQLRIDAREIQNKNISYTVETLTAMRYEYGVTQPIAIVLGMDAFLNLPKWHSWTALFGLTHIIVLNRPGIEPNLDPILAVEWFSRKTTDKNTLFTAASGAILPIEITPLSVSATAIRTAIYNKQIPRFLLPEAVYDYIHLHKIYGAYIAIK